MPRRPAAQGSTTRRASSTSPLAGALGRAARPARSRSGRPPSVPPSAASRSPAPRHNAGSSLKPCLWSSRPHLPSRLGRQGEQPPLTEVPSAAVLTRGTEPTQRNPAPMAASPGVFTTTVTWLQHHSLLRHSPRTSRGGTTSRAQHSPRRRGGAQLAAPRSGAEEPAAGGLAWYGGRPPAPPGCATGPRRLHAGRNARRVPLPGRVRRVGCYVRASSVVGRPRWGATGVGQERGTREAWLDVPGLRWTGNGFAGDPSLPSRGDAPLLSAPPWGPPTPPCFPTRTDLLHPFNPTQHHHRRGPPAPAPRHSKDQPHTTQTQPTPKTG